MKIFNRNHIKIIALVSMLLDHVGVMLFPNIIWFRIFGRIAFPLFAFFIAEGYYYTKNKFKYMLLLLIFAVISIYPYFLMKSDWFNLNILFSFLFSVCIMWLIEKLYKSEGFTKLSYTLIILMITLVAALLSAFGFLEYGMLSVLLPVVLWMLKRKPNLQLVAMTVLLLLYYIEILIFTSFKFSYQIFSLSAVPILVFYNGNKGKINLKYMFYVFYPLHLVILYIIKLILF